MMILSIFFLGGGGEISLANPEAEEFKKHDVEIQGRTGKSPPISGAWEKGGCFSHWGNVSFMKVRKSSDSKSTIFGLSLNPGIV